MDKIREGFEKRHNLHPDYKHIGDDGYYRDSQLAKMFAEYKAGYKSRDEEIKELIKHKIITRNIINLRNKKIKKLRDALEDIWKYSQDNHKDLLSVRVEVLGGIAIKALKESE